MKKQADMPVLRGGAGLNLAFFFFLLVPVFQNSPAEADERKVTATIALKEEYSDNLFFTADDAETDFITTVSPGLELNNATDRLNVGLKARWDGSMYQENSGLNALDHDYSGSLRYALTERANMFSSAGYKRDSRPDRDFTDTGLLLDAVEREQYRFSMGGGYALSEIFSMQMQYAYAEDTYAKDTSLSSDYTDTTSHDVTTTFSRDLSEYWANTVGRINLGLTVYDSDKSESSNFSATVGMERKLTELFSFHIDAGLRYTESQYDSYRLVATSDPLVFVWQPYEIQTDGIGFMGRSGVSYRDELNDGTLSVSHDVQAASGSSGTVERTSLQFQVGRRLTETSRIFCSTGYTINKSTEDIADVSTTDETSWRLSPGISYDVTQEFRVVGSYNYARVDDKAADEERDRNLFMVRLEYRYPLME